MGKTTSYAGKIMSDVIQTTSDIIFRPCCPLKTRILQKLSIFCHFLVNQAVAQIPCLGVVTEHPPGFQLPIVSIFRPASGHTKRRTLRMRPFVISLYSGFYASTFANVAFCSMNSRRGPTSSPISMENM